MRHDLAAASLDRLKRLAPFPSVLALLTAAGCGSGTTCKDGTERCPCYGNGTCNAGLVCLSNICVNPGISGIDGGGGVTGTGGTDGAAGVSGSGGAAAGLDVAVTVFPIDAGGGGASDASVNIDAPAASADTGPDAVGRECGETGGVAEDSAADIPSTVVLPTCGDGLVVFPEQCDDGNASAADGCSGRCRIEIGFKCDGTPSVCTPTTCGDGKVEGLEGCDDSNSMPFDGCSSDCRREPVCNGGAPCASSCGDGFVIDEDCDDGNATDGDGCSSDCQVEPGWVCSQPPLGNRMVVPAIYRAFHPHSPTDFEPGVTGQRSVSTGIVFSDLDSDGKPVFAGVETAAAHVASQATFAQWFRNTDGVNHANASTMVLWDDGNGGYVNRYGANGEKWDITMNASWCGNVGAERRDADGNPIPCTFQTDAGPAQTDCDKMEAQGYARLRCFVTSGTTYQAIYGIGQVDGTPLYFPVDADPFVPTSERIGAQVPSEPVGLYDASGTWPWDVDDTGNKRLHSFSFTSEIRHWFKYEAAHTYVLPFNADDDVWVFINKRLALDLGGIHTPVAGSIVLGPDAAGKLGLSDGGVYEIAVFQAQRQSTCSSLQVTLPPFNAAPSECAPK